MSELNRDDWIRTLVPAVVGALPGAVVGFVGTCLVSTLLGDPPGHENLFPLFAFTGLGGIGGMIGGPTLPGDVGNAGTSSTPDIQLATSPHFSQPSSSADGRAG